MIFLPPDKYESFLQVGSIILDVRNHTCPNTRSNKFVISLKARKMRLIFYLQKNITWFFKLILLFQVCVTWYAQITQNNKFSISFHYLQKEVSDEVFCMQIRLKITYKLILRFLMGMVKHSQSSQNSKFAMPLQYLEKEVRCEVDFLNADKHKIFYKLI